MNPRVRFPWSAKPIAVATRAETCPALSCFRPAEHIIRSPCAGYSGTFSRPTGEYRCNWREAWGCPPEAERTPDTRFRKVRGVWRQQSEGAP